MAFARFMSLMAAAALAGCAYPYTPPALAPVAAPPPLVVAAQGAEARRPPVTIMVSIDGFRPDYLHHGRTPALDATAEGGVSATMTPSFPSLTFPNHEAMATGLRPDRSGMISNTMEDPARPGVQFTISDPKQNRDPFWWNGSEPIWVAAEKAGIRTGVMFWPGSDVPIHDTRPANWFTYDAAVTTTQRVDAVLDWLRRPADTRPTLAITYFDVVDKASHNHGIGSPEWEAAVTNVDAGIARLRAGLVAMGQPANLIVVSDHGMAPVPLGQTIAAQDWVDDATMHAIVEGPMLAVFPKTPADDGRVATRLVGRHPHFTCWRRENLPARFHYGRNPRVAPFLCLTETGWRFSTQPPKTFVAGDHGFDPADLQMQAMFLANGPAFGRGTLATFDNVDVYPLVRRLIGLPPASGIDGTDAPFARILRR